MILIADSGATKADWALLKDKTTCRVITTEGLNPVFQTLEHIQNIIGQEIVPFLNERVECVHFYGAGVVDGQLKEVLSSIFPHARVSCCTDMLGAARSVCGTSPGIVCILGTGSNSCLYDGENIVDNVKSGGYVLGDEASGAYMGRVLLSDFIKGLMPPDIEVAFKQRYTLDYPSIVENVYRKGNPSRFLASFSPFIYEHRDNGYMKFVIEHSITSFLRRNVRHYDFMRYDVNFVGSIASMYRDNLTEVLQNEGMRLGKIETRPIEGLVAYHG